MDIKIEAAPFVESLKEPEPTIPAPFGQHNNRHQERRFRPRIVVVGQCGDVLTSQEGEVARLVCNGLPNKVIADRLGISPHTVSTYLRRIYLKLGVANKAALVSRLLTVQGGD
jgi:DNA-binding CsgD family transcriptional regulator